MYGEKGSKTVFPFWEVLITHNKNYNVLASVLKPTFMETPT